MTRPRDPLPSEQRGGYGASFAGRKTLITGGLGFIGSNLACRLADLGAEVLLVDGAVDAFLLAGASEAVNGEVFNLGGLQPVSMCELIQTLVRLAGSGSYRIVPFPEERRRIDIGDFYADYGRIRRTLGWEPRVGLEVGLARTLDFYRSYRKHYWAPS